MSEHSVVDRQPEAVELDGTGGNTLLVAAPALGPDAAPSELVSPVAVADRFDSGRPLGDEASADGGVTTGGETPLDENADVCVVPDLYAAYCEVDDAAGLTAALDSQTPLVAVVAPHELDWLLGSDSPFAESHLGGFDRIVQLRYDPDGGEADETVRAAVDAAAAALAKDDPSETDRRAIWSALESFAYSHEYSHEALADAGADGQYGPTLTPGIAAYVSTEGRAGVGTDDFDALAPKAVRKTSDPDASADGRLARGRAAVRDLANTVSGGLGVSNATSAVAALAAGSVGAAGGPAAAAAIGFAAWAATREGDDGVATVFQLLDDGRVPPPTQAQLEASLGVPPGTVETTAELVRPGSLRRLREIVDDAPEAIREVETALDATDDSLAGTLTRLDERTREVGALYDDQMAAAAKSLDAVADELQSDEAALLGPLVDREEIDPDQIPWVEVVADGDGENGDEGDSRETEIRTATRMSVAAGEKERPEQIDELIQTATSRSVTVLRGGHGTGKTTATYRAGRALEERGYTVRVPGLDSVDPTTVEHGLQQDADEEPLALVISFKRALAGESLDGHLRAVQSWIDSGLVDTVLIECREEFYDEFRQELPESNAGLGVVELESFDADETAPITAVARWVRDTLARAGAVADSVDPDAERIPDTKREEIVDLAAGNSEITKVAAKFAFASDYSLDEIHTHEELVRDDIDHLIEEAPDTDAEAVELLFDYLGVAGVLRTRDLWALSDFDDVSLKRLARALSGYLGPDVRQTLDQCGPGPWDDSDNGPDVADVAWRLSPAIYRDVTFRAALTEPKTRWRDSAFEELYTRLRELSLENSPVSFHRNVAGSFATAHEAARHREERDGSEIPERADGDIRNYEPVGPERVETQAQQFVEWVDEDCGPGAFVGSLTQISFGLVPVDPSVFDSPERLHAGAEAEASQRDVESAAVLHNILGSQLAANVEDSDSRTTLRNDADAFAAAVAESDEYDPGQFLSNVYSVAISKLAELSSLAEASEWTEWASERADTAAVHGSHDADPAVFLENIYSMAIGNLAELSSLAEVSEWTEWVIERADTAAVRGSHDADPAQFLENVYSMAIGNLAELSSLAEASEWTEWVAQRADTVAIDGSHDDDPGQFLSNVYSMAISNLADSFSPADASEWTEWVTQRADTAAVHGSHDLPPAQFLENVYSMAIEKLAELSSPTDASERTEWVTQRANTAAVRGSHDADPAQFLSNVYSMAIVNLADSFSPAEASEWTDWLTKRANTAAVRGSHDADPGQFLSNVYSMVISKLADSSSPADASEWTEWVIERADTAAVRGSHDLPPAQFLSNVYSMAINKLADSSSPAEASEWIDRVYEAIQRYASSDTHGRTRDEFVADCCAMALAKVTPNLPAIESVWHADILTRSLKATPSAALTRFYVGYATALGQADVNGVWLSWIVTDCLDQTIHAEQPVTDEPEGLAASVVANTLFGPAANVDDGLAAIPELPDTVAKLATDREAFETVLDGVETRYADGNVSEWVLNDPESTDVQAVGQRVLAWVRGRAFVHAVTDDADTVAADICDAAVETAREASEPEVPLARFYTVALVGLAAETDPENTGAHDDLLGDALQHEAIKSLRFCLAYFRELSSADGYLPGPAPNFDTFEWHLHLVDDLLTRAETDAAGLPDEHEQTGEMIAGMLATMANETYPASGPTRKFHTLLDTVADHDTDAAVTAHAIERVPELLDENANLLAKFDWEERFV